MKRRKKKKNKGLALFEVDALDFGRRRNLQRVRAPNRMKWEKPEAMERVREVGEGHTFSEHVSVGWSCTAPVRIRHSRGLRRSLNRS